MPKKAPKAASAPAENTEHGAPSSTPSTGPTIDLSGWKNVPTATPAASATPAKRTKVERPLRPQIGIEEIAGISGCLVVDVFEPPAHAEYGQSAGLIVRLPAHDAAHPATDVLAFVNYRTVAGRKTRDALTTGPLATLDATKPETFVPLNARAKMSPEFPKGRPMVFLTFGNPVGTKA